MKIILLHNTYQQRGGEDSVFENEYNLLKKYGHNVDKLIFDNNSIKTVKDKILTGILGIYNFKSAKLLENKIKSFKPDIIHVHNFFPIASPSIFFIAEKYKIPVIMTLHNFRLICPNALLFRNGYICEECINKIFPIPGIIHKCYRGSFSQTLSLSFIYNIHRFIKTWQKKIDKFITLTEFQKNKFLVSSLDVPEKKFTVKPNFSEDFGEGFKNRENYFLYVGRLSKEKGILTMLKAFSKTNMNLKIIGDGDLKEIVLKFSKQYKNIEYLGLRSKVEVFNLLKKSKALIFPSECYEGFPMVLVEALSTSTPVITSNIGSQAEIIKDKYIGLHFQVGNSEDLKKRLLDFSQKDYNFLYKNARIEYLNNYTPEKNYKRLMSIYEEVINASKKKSY